MNTLNDISVTISFTTIHTRIHLIEKVVASIFNQTHQNFELRLYISQEPYLLDQGIAEIPESLTPYTGEKFKIIYTPNTGPYRKLIPCLTEYWEQKDKVIITIDDDVEYPPQFVATLLLANSVHDCPVAYRGREIVKQDNKIAPYAVWKKANVAGKSMAKLPTGKDGVLYKPRYFHENVLNIKDAMEVCRTADDIWFKWHTMLNAQHSVLLFNNLSESFASLDPNDKMTLFDQYNKSSSKDKVLNQNDVHIQTIQEYVRSTLKQEVESLWS